LASGVAAPGSTPGVQHQLQFDAERHIYSVDGRAIPSVTQILEACGVVDYSYLPPETRKMALARGSAVHLACQFDDEGDFDEASAPELLPYVEAWRRFCAEQGMTFLDIERRVYSAKYGYAGTLDRIGTNGRDDLCLIDLKTNSSEGWVRLQTAAYAGALDEPRRYLRGCAELHKDGTYRAMWFPAAEWQKDFSEFLACLAVLRLQERFGVRAPRKERQAA
jgi:hypothetical protein